MNEERSHNRKHRASLSSKNTNALFYEFAAVGEDDDEGLENSLRMSLAMSRSLRVMPSALITCGLVNPSPHSREMWSMFRFSYDTVFPDDAAVEVSKDAKRRELEEAPFETSSSLRTAPKTRNNWNLRTVTDANGGWILVAFVRTLLHVLISLPLSPAGSGPGQLHVLLLLLLEPGPVGAVAVSPVELQVRAGGRAGDGGRGVAGGRAHAQAVVALLLVSHRHQVGLLRQRVGLHPTQAG